MRYAADFMRVFSVTLGNDRDDAAVVRRDDRQTVVNHPSSSLHPVRVP
jgi:hypothetical protein